MATDADSGGFNSFGTLRRSLRQINPFKNKFFRLPATPRLSRSRKVMGRGEEATSWNFERPTSIVGSIRESNLQPPPASSNNNIVMNKHHLQDDTPTYDTPSSSSYLPEYEYRRGEVDDMSSIYGFPPDGVSQLGGSCRLSSNRHSRPPLPTFNPPNAHEAQTIVHEHIKNLMPSPQPPPSRQQLLFLPNTSYAPSGEICDARWQDKRKNNDSPLISPTQSTISLINTQNRAFRSASTGGSMRQDRHSLRPSYQLNGLFNHPSLKSLSPSVVAEVNILCNSLSKQSFLKISPLFSLSDVLMEGEAENAFLGREWVFKELYQMIVIEHSTFTFIQGSNGSGKTSITRQLVLQSSFFSQNSVNGDTVDSGIVVESQNSLNSTLSSKNYEWLRAVGVRIVGYHNCRLYHAATCVIPEFVLNIASHMYNSSLLQSYADLIRENKELVDLLTSDTLCFSIEPIELFRKLIIEPLKRVVISDDECMIIIIDAIDEADFHRNESGESIAWLLKQVSSQLPVWLRFILTSATLPPLCGLNVRTLQIDDAELDQRVMRDTQIMLEYRITVSPQLEQKLRSCSASESVNEIIDELVTRSRGNQLFLTLLLDLIEQNRINVMSSSIALLPIDLFQLYLLYFNLTFKSLAHFHTISPLISIIISSLKPLTFNEIYLILNSSQPEPYIGREEVAARLSMLTPMIIKLSNDKYAPLHPTFREWVIKISDQTDYAVDIRQGHILHSLFLVRKGNLSPELFFELGHHLLKANPYKYMRPGTAPDLPNGKDCHVLWLKKAAGHPTALQNSLLYERNCYYPNSKVSRLLLLSGANPNACWPEGSCLLSTFANTGNVTMIQLLIQFNVDVNFVNPKTGQTPIFLAVQKAHLEAVRILYENGARVNIYDDNDLSLLDYAAKTNSVKLMSFLLECEWSLRNQKDKGKNRAEALKRAFETAAANGQVQICEFLLDCTDAITNTSTAMCVACANGQSETVQFLLSRGATLSTNQYWQGKSALICAIESGSWDLVVNVLNSSNIDLNTDNTSEDGWTPLIVAARHGHVGLVDLLINRGANIDVKDKKGLTAIMHTVICRHASTAALLIDRGCDTTVKDNNGNGLIHLLAQYSNKCLIDRLLEKGLSLEDKNNEDLRAVEIAIRYGNQNAVDIFLRRGARLRTLTWRIAVISEPEFVLVLIRKLLDDAAILFRRKRPLEALHRFEYALEKCSELMGDKIDQENLVTSCVVKNKTEFIRLAPIQGQLREYKVQILLAMASLKRKNHELADALSYTTEGLRLAENVDSRFELYLCRAKCFFDNQNVTKAREDAEAAAVLRPDNSDVKNLLSILSMPSI